MAWLHIPGILRRQREGLHEKPFCFLSRCTHRGGSVRTGSAELSDDDRQAVHDEVAAQLESFWQVWRQTDYDRGIALYDDHPDFSFASEGTMWRSLAAFDSVFRPVFADVQSQDVEFEETHIVVLGRDHVYSAQRGTYSRTLPDGTTTSPNTFAFTSVWVRSNGEWKVRLGHFSEPSF